MPNKAKVLPSLDRLNELLTYDPETGILRWKVHRYRISAGAVAGCLDRRRGYWNVKLDDVSYKAHRIIWKMVTGKDPVAEIDHINRNTSDNKFSNLREADRFQNMANRKRPITNSSGIKGVCWHKGTQKWMVQLQAGAGKKYIGVFENLEAAEAAAIGARNSAHGEFARAA